VPQANIVGRPGEGWTQAKFLLGHERTTIAGIAELRRDLARIDALVAGGDVGTFHGIDWQLRERTRIEARIEALSMLEARTALDPHLTAPHFASILKVAGTELQQQIDDFGLRLLGPAMLAMAPESVRRGANPAEPGPTGTSTLAGRFFYRRAASIYGGTSEIQRNLIARAVISDKQGHSA
jgi:alkylation response protein AidB-like acyl-CoA dehydrogenase